MEITIKLEPRETEALINALCGSKDSWKECPALLEEKGESHTISMGGIMNFKDLPEEIQEMLKSNLGNLGGGPSKNKK